MLYSMHSVHKFKFYIRLTNENDRAQNNKAKNYFFLSFFRRHFLPCILPWIFFLLFFINRVVEKTFSMVWRIHSNCFGFRFKFLMNNCNIFLSRETWFLRKTLTENHERWDSTAKRNLNIEIILNLNSSFVTRYIHYTLYVLELRNWVNKRTLANAPHIHKK